jgi:3-oxoacyl-[acyl-carrier protein] reductase
MSPSENGQVPHAAVDPTSRALGPGRAGTARSAARLEGKIAIITGGASGIGREIARVFAVEGARIVVADINEAGARETAADIVSAGGQALCVPVDISDPRRVRALVDETVGRYDGIDILVNNAGVALNRPFLETTLEEWNRLLDVVLTGTFLCSQAAARVMVPRRSGTIINIASVSGQRGAQGRAAYGAAKAGVIQLTRIMAVELAAAGLRVNAISPGPVVTDQSNGTHTAATRQSYLDRIPLHRYGERHEIAAAALFLASDESTFIQGHVLNVDGGFHAAGLMFDPEAD